MHTYIHTRDPGERTCMGTPPHQFIFNYSCTLPLTNEYMLYDLEINIYLK